MPRPLTVAACRAAGRSQTGSASTRGNTLSEFIPTKTRESCANCCIQATAEITGIGDATSAAARSFGQGGKDRFYFLETGDRVARRTLVSYDGIEFLEIRAHILDRKFVAMQEG